MHLRKKICLSGGHYHLSFESQSIPSGKEEDPGIFLPNYKINILVTQNWTIEFNYRTTKLSFLKVLRCLSDAYILGEKKKS